MNFLALLSLIFLIYSCSSQTVKIVKSPIIEMKYQNKVIHPACFQKFLSPERISTIRVKRNIKALGEFYVPLAEYRSESLKDCMMNGASFSNDGEGSVTYHDPADSRGIAMLRYRPLLKTGKDSYLVYTVENGGGTGYFTQLFLVKLTDDKLILEGVASNFGGDRCNGGTTISKVDRDSIIVKKNYTPLGLISELLAGKNFESDLYDQLDTSALSCITKKVMNISVKDGVIKSEEKGFSEFTINESDYEMQDCFNKQLKLALKNSDSKYISKEKLGEFSKSFRNKCL